MKKYEKIIERLYQLDKASGELHDEKMKHHPDSEEWETAELIEKKLDEVIMREIEAFRKCITWYRQRIKT